jgi:hypothetical protein
MDDATNNVRKVIFVRQTLSTTRSPTSREIQHSKLNRDGQRRIQPYKTGILRTFMVDSFGFMC